MHAILVLMTKLMLIEFVFNFFNSLRGQGLSTFMTGHTSPCHIQPYLSDSKVSATEQKNLPLVNCNFIGIVSVFYIKYYKSVIEMGPCLWIVIVTPRIPIHTHTHTSTLIHTQYYIYTHIHNITLIHTRNITHARPPTIFNTHTHAHTHRNTLIHTHMQDVN